MKRSIPTYLRGLILSGMLVMMSLHSYASHVIGAELRYRYIPNTCDSYEVTVFLYGDCNAPSFPAFQGLPVSQPQVCVFDGATPVATYNLNFPVPQCGAEVTPVCPDSLAWTTCNNTSYPVPGIKKFVYSKTIWIPYRSANWKFVYTSTNNPPGGTGGTYTCGGSLTGIGGSGPVSSGRTSSITNITPGTSVQLVTTLNNSFTNPRGHNSSPVLTVEPVPYYCNLYLNCYNPGAVDLNDISPSEPSGDSMAFTLVPATNGTGACGVIGGPVTYVGPGISGANPLTVSAPISFDPLTGQLCFTPSTTQRSVVVYNIAEYINDTLGQMSTSAGTGVAGFGGDGAPAISAQLNRPAGICMNAAGVTFIADCQNNRIRKIDVAGNISTIAGTGVAGYSGDGGTAITAKINHPMGIATDAAGNVFFADFNNNVVRKINLAGTITTIAGNGTAGFAGDGGPAAAPACELNSPVAVFVDGGNNIYISDNGNQRIRRISPGGIINTIAGTGATGYVGDGGPAIAAVLNQPYGLYVDAVPNVYFADAGNNVIRKISVGGVITTIAGTGVAGFSGDGGLAIAAKLNNPTGVFLNNQGYLLIADRYNNRIRIIDSCGYINTIDGNGTPGFAGDGGLPASAEIDSAMFVVSDPQENLFISDYRNNRIREVIRNANINKTQVGTMQREMNFLVQTCTYTEPSGKIDTGYGGGITKIDSTHYYGCANSGTFTLLMNPTEGDTSLHITVTGAGFVTGLVLTVDSNATNHPHAIVTGNTGIIAPGNYTFYLTYTDNHCPLTGTRTVAFSVQILPVPTIRDSLISAATCVDSAKFMIIPGGTGKPWTIKVSHTVPITDTFQIFTGDTTAFKDSLPPGTYVVTIFTNVSTDCAQWDTIRLDTSRFVITAVGTNPTYCGAANGKIAVHGMTPGKADSIFFKYQGVWQPGQGFLVSAAGTDTITGLLAGPYDSIVVREGLCQSNYITGVNEVILVNPPFNFRAVTTHDPTKCGFCDGLDTLWGLHPGQLDTIKYNFVPYGGITSTTFSLIHSIGLDSMVVISGLCAGAYTNYVVNTAGVCADSLPGPYVLNPQRLWINFDTAIHYGCHGDTVFFNNLSAPAADLTYTWYFGDGATGTQTNPTHIYYNTTANTVTITLNITNTKCDSTHSITKTFDNHIKAGFTFLPDPFVCQDSLVAFTNTSAGTNPTYTWLFGDGNTSIATNPTHAYVNSGKYTITLVANENMIPIPSPPDTYTRCYDTMKQTITVDSNSAVSIMATDSILCQGQAITFTGIYTTLDKSDTMVSWAFGDGSAVFDQNPILHSYDDSGAFTVNLSVYYRSCPSSSATRNVHVFGYPSIYLGPDLAICPGGTPIKLIDDRNKDNAYASWRWNTGETSPGITVVKPGTYVNVVTINGCTAADTVFVQKDCYMDIPNVFTPNGDGTNDYFYPRQMLTKGLVTFKMDIYNRWGQLIYETTAIDGRGWDGNFNDQPQPEGVYVYMIDAVFKDGQIEHHTGNVTLLR